MADSVGELSSPGGTTFSLGLSSMLSPSPASLVSRGTLAANKSSLPNAGDQSAFPTVPSHIFTASQPSPLHQDFSEADESENEGPGMTPGVDTNSMGPCDSHGDAAPSDDDESDDEDIVSDGTAERVELCVRPIDDMESPNVSKGSRRWNKSSETWARARFDAWRSFSKISTDESIEEMSEQDMQGLADLLGTFFREVRKQDGTMYPPETTGRLLRTVGRIIRTHQEAHIVQTGVTEPPFSIISDARFRKAQLAANESMVAAGKLGLGKRRKKIDVLTISDELSLLSLSYYKPTSGKGASMRFAYFCTRNFFIRGPAELHEVKDVDFTLGKDQFGEFLRYDERSSKNFKTDLQHGQAEKLRRPVTCYIADVVSTYKIMAQHRAKWADEELPPHPFFLTDTKNPTSKDVWYTRSPVGLKAITAWVKTMTKDAGLEGRYSNKTGRTTALTRLTQAGVPIKISKRITGSRDAASQIRFDPDLEGIRERAMQRIVSGEVDKCTQRLIVWSEALALETEVYKKLQSSGTADQAMVLQASRREICTFCEDREVVCEGSGPTTYKEIVCCDSCKQNAHCRDAYEKHRALVDELEKTKDLVTDIERKLQGKEIQCGQDPHMLPPPHTDIVFQARDGRKAYAHKAVLVGQSEAFKAMFSNTTEETGSRMVKMDMSYATLEAFVLFFYTASVTDPTLESHSVELLQVADKYGVKALKAICEEQILRSLTPNEVLITYVVGWTNNSEVVKEGVLDYAAREIDDVSSLDGYYTFSRKCPDVVMALYDGVVKRLKRKKICAPSSEVYKNRERDIEEERPREALAAKRRKV